MPGCAHNLADYAPDPLLPDKPRHPAVPDPLVTRGAVLGCSRKMALNLELRMASVAAIDPMIISQIPAQCYLPERRG